MADYRANESAFLQELAGLLTASGPVTSDYPLTDENWDSMAVMSAIALIDTQFRVTIPGHRLQGCTSVGQLCDVVRTAVEQRLGNA